MQAAPKDNWWENITDEKTLVLLLSSLSVRFQTKKFPFLLI